MITRWSNVRCKMSDVTKARNSGFSLLELLLYIAVLSIVMTMLVGVFFSINRSRGRVEAQSEVNSSLRFAVERIGQDIKSSSQISTPVAAGNTSNNLVINNDGPTIEYCINANMLRRQESGTCDGNSPTITSDKVKIESLSFSRIENSNANFNKKIVSLEVNISASYNSMSPDWQYSASKKTTISQKQW